MATPRGPRSSSPLPPAVCSSVSQGCDGSVWKWLWSPETQGVTSTRVAHPGAFSRVFSSVSF